MTTCSTCFGAQVKPSDGIKLNVGGSLFTTSRQTLQKCEKLAKLITQRPGADGAHFIDRDGRYFAEILTFCRDGKELFIPPTDETARRILQHEAAYYGLDELADLVRDSYVGAPIPSDEKERVAKLDALNIMHTDDREFHYDAITAVTAAVLDVPICLISLVHSDHQWFKSRVGLQADRTSRNSSFCAVTFTPEDPEAHAMLLIEDAKSDARTANNPLVLGEPHIGFYAGCPIVTSDGFRLGALCAIDHVPRSITAVQAQVLVNLAQFTAQEIQASEHLKDLEDEGEEADSTIDETGTMSFAAGKLRKQRMTEALREAVVLCRVSLESGDWPLLYGNQYFTHLSGIRLMPSQRPNGKATASGPGMRYLRGNPTQDVGLWDWLHLSGKGEKQLRSEVTLAFEQPEAGIFALQATAPVISSTGSQHMSRGTERMKLSCRFTPCDLPIDVAAQAIRPVPQRVPGSTQGGSLPHFGNDKLYFVTLRVIGEPSTKVGSSSCASTPTSLNTGSMPDSSTTTPRKSSGKAVEALQVMKPARSPFQDVRLLRMVGHGSFGKVFCALWMGSTVAVKIIESKVSDKMKKFQPVFEAALSTSIAHPNLVQTYNYSTRAKPQEGDQIAESDGCIETWMVQEWCDRGTLHTLCQTLWQIEDPLQDIIDICSDVSRAGSYLHARGIIHGDLTANNVLVKTQVSRKGYICKIADFGLARILEGNDVDIMTTQLGTVTHMPPELFDVTKDIKLTTKADIYAMGMLIYECFAGESPHAGLSAPQVIVQVMKGKRLKLPNTAPAAFEEVFVKCTSTNPKERPTFDDLVLIFEGNMNINGAGVA